MQYSLLCIVDWEEGTLEEGETPDKWTPLMRDIELEQSSPPSSSSSNGPISARAQASPSSATLPRNWASDAFQPTPHHLSQPIMRANAPLPPHMPYGPPQYPTHAHPRSWAYRHDYQDPHSSTSLALQTSAGMARVQHHLITTDQISVMTDEARTNNGDTSAANMSLSVPTAIGRRSSDMTSLLTLMLDSPSPTDTQGWPHASPPF